MQGKRFVFAGNRSYVLDEMRRAGLTIVRTLVVRGSYLDRSLQDQNIEFEGIDSKSHLIDVLASTEFDYFVANGCPYILPISQLARDGKVFVNVHPSRLPDLRGADPVPGALLLGRNSGATCHIMDDGVDTGPIISRMTIPNTPDLDAGLLYQLSFMAEVEVFNLARERGFTPATDNELSADCVYYTRQPGDLFIDFGESTAGILARVRAFSNRSQGARVRIGATELRVHDAEPVRNPYLLERIDCYGQNEVVFKYGSSLVIRHDDAFLKLKDIVGDLSKVHIGDTL